jgi:predicted DNA-binding transcriptional regulator AlpA
MAPKNVSPEIVATAYALLAAPNARMRLPHVLAVMQVSRSGWYDGIAKLIYPRPQRIGHGGRAVAWLSSDIRAVLEARKTAGGAA